MSAGPPPTRYHVSVQGTEHVVDLLAREGRLDVVVDGRAVDADLTALHAGGLHSLLVDGHSREMILEREGDRTFVSLDGERIEVRVQDEVSRALAAFDGPKPPGDSEVRAPMPGVVVAIPVRAGDRVVAGQPVIVMEAMKMQNELGAECDGVVERIEVSEGQTVDGGALLAVIRAGDPGE